MKNALGRAVCVLIGLAVLHGFSAVREAAAKVTGPCVNCHTMHNSQHNAAVARSGQGIGWDGSGQLSGGSASSVPNQTLLVTGCVGCHTSTTSQTIIQTTGGSRIPIVFNTVPPSQPLAGGNFYWVSQPGNDNRGHNVHGVAAVDAVLTTAPGRTPGSCTNSCHDSLAAAPSAQNSDRGGCQGCHVFTSHHDDSRPWYRFLKGHTSSPTLPIPQAAINGTDYVQRAAGSEAADWEQNPTATSHNSYKGSDMQYGNGFGLELAQSVTAFCSGCHSRFHGPRTADPQVGLAGMGSQSPWIRHPTDIRLPQSGEYAGYDPIANYNPQAPVAWLNPATPVRAEAVVMCLSCHRPHGSDQPDMLRWNYETMIAGGGGSGGCFTCHTTKNTIL